ncbi:hypothetical protein F383_33482 [Gossypium arboreum]|uniref:Uncharacterized protein n=1 Tax=Gossypium arboreum TaxID=29729 RepID=A0A0B0MY82_GOSAR|nr:hypothetical protein F383_33482 [Gossypium arboreum]
MKICLNELNLNMFILRTKEIGFGSRKNESRRQVALFRFTSSKLVTMFEHSFRPSYDV